MFYFHCNALQFAESLRNLVAITLPCPTKAKPTKTTIIINSMSFLEEERYDHDG